MQEAHKIQAPASLSRYKNPPEKNWSSPESFLGDSSLITMDSTYCPRDNKDGCIIFSTTTGILFL